MKNFLAAICLWAAVSCAAGPGTITDDSIEKRIGEMSLREKVGTLFFVRPEALEGRASEAVTSLSVEAKDFYRNYPVGGIVLFAHNIVDSTQLLTFTEQLHSLPGHPLLCIDEEGGRVARIGNNDAFDVPRFASMEAIGKSGKSRKAYEAGYSIGTYLREFGFDVDFAPVADVNTNPENRVIGSRAFSSDPRTAAKMAVACMRGLRAAGIIPCLKHFPGHGDTFGDTHEGFVEVKKSWEEMLSAEIVPFRAGIRYNVPMIMAAHISAPAVTGDDLPASLSSAILVEKLRKELGFGGVIITDSLGMGAISDRYSSAEAALKCFMAGADVILMPDNLPEAFEAVVAAVQNGTITQERLDESVRRILLLK